MLPTPPADLPDQDTIEDFPPPEPPHRKPLTAAALATIIPVECSA